MARKRRQQYRRRPPPMVHRDDGPADQAVEDAAARLASSQTVDELRLLVTRSRQFRDSADQRAQQDPDPEALRRFRMAVRENTVAERALGVAEDAQVSPTD